MRNIGNIYCYVFLSLFIFSCKQKDVVSSAQVKKLDYPSASSIEYYDGKLYVMGDDATNLLIIDTNFNIIDSITLFSYSGRRMPKNTKPDLEASAIDDDVNLYFFGSGSAIQRNLGLKYNLKTKKTDSIRLEPLYTKIKSAGIEQINIEGACFISQQLILVNRGNKSYQHNQLIIIDEAFLKNDTSYNFSILPFEIQKDTTFFKGISGLSYVKQIDRLIMTVSTENTRNAYDDGEIGKSYLWIIDHISSKLGNKIINADKIIDMEEIDQRLKNQKLESVTLISETDKLLRLAVVADNDDGSSTIFKLSIDKD